MAAYLVTYDLTQEASWSSYSDLTKAIEKLGGLNTQKSVWLVQYSNSATSLFEALEKHVHDKDRLFVAELAKGGSWLSRSFKGTNDWMTRNIGSAH
ncbi:MAG: CRISPR-associated endoribonuclease Cas2 [Luteibacter sp.]|uniref:hypothetical protein n=1 Tax=Luteibacter sp. TaxID=1886636 RepID=UPI001384ABFD|nr:hypothetical protein [Luteibacter sp.]KAF1005421.1 MAG: CRISPR-associated endoribonuclease Cas2 [Luteibacter sp.]